ncbi:MAG: hypothetical protein [Caudoviricetes sp.]|nr:MAG: hypothetical protein [Caudoviricetes sp.]
MNPRWKAFLKRYHDVEFKNNTVRNVCFMAFISDMISLYTNTNNALDPRRVIHDHDDFTKFVEENA